MPYKVTVQGQVFNTDHLTLDEAVQIEKDTDESWLFMTPLRSAAHARAIMVAFLARDVGRDAASKIVGAMPVGDVIDGIENVEDDLPVEYEDGLPDPKAGQ